MILFVTTQQRTYSHDHPRLVFMDILTGRSCSDLFFYFYFFFFFFSPPPNKNTVTADVRGYTLYCIYAMWRMEGDARDGE